MHEIIEEACKKLKIELPHLNKVSEESQKYVNYAREYLTTNVSSENENVPIDVVALGSLARYEVTKGSDLDYVVIAHSLPNPNEIQKTRELLSYADSLRGELQLKNPGRTGMFNAVLSAPDLTERIGLEQDTNLSHSRRILLLQESVSLYQPDLHKKLISGILSRYLIDYKEPKKGVPRFLLNDVMRYWRTLAVDYQAKRWEADDAKWGLRFLKLIISRKIVYAGTMTSLLLTKEATNTYFYDQFQMPSLARIAQLYDMLEEKYLSDLSTVLRIYDTFIGKLSSTEFRDKAKKVYSPHDIKKYKEFYKMRLEGKKLQKALENIFFHSSILKEKAITYMSF